MQLKREFYLRPTLTVAPDLLGKFLIFHSPEGIKVGQINEVEAYLGALDPAAHSFHGKTARNASIFLPGGHAYVYFTYGMHYCLNVGCEGEGIGNAVLLRSVIPVEGLAGVKTDGPGKLCRAFGITRAQNGIDLTSSNQLYIEDRGVKVSKIITTPRIGISKAKDMLWRFVAME